jgi:hypothetical protein
VNQSNNLFPNFESFSDTFDDDESTYCDYSSYSFDKKDTIDDVSDMIMKMSLSKNKFN